MREGSQNDRVADRARAAKPRRTQTVRPLDDTDRRILALLRENARRTFEDVGTRVALSATAVKRRIDRLERDGHILGYHAVLAAPEPHRGLHALIEIHCASRFAPTDIGTLVSAIPFATQAFTVSGDADVVVEVRVGDVSELEDLVSRLRHHPAVEQTRTMVVLSRWRGVQT